MQSDMHILDSNIMHLNNNFPSPCMVLITVYRGLTVYLLFQ